MTLADAFLADILDRPADDTPRLVYADWLEDNGESGRAEFVRVQVELAREPPARPSVTAENWGAEDARERRWNALRRREWELLAGHWHAWAGVWGLPVACGNLLEVDPGERALVVTFRRGFVAEVRLPLAFWLERGPALVAAHPLERVTLTGRRPLALSDDTSSPGDPWHGWFAWGDGRLTFGPDAPDDPDDPYQRDLPRDVFALLAGGRRLESNPFGVYYPSEAEALADSSAALILWAKGVRA